MNQVILSRCSQLGAAGTLAASKAGAEGTFDIPAGGVFNPQKLYQIANFLTVSPMAIQAFSCAVVLIEKHASRSTSGVGRSREGQRADDRRYHLPHPFDDQAVLVAAMMLVDEGKLCSTTRRQYIPSFARPSGGREEGGERRAGRSNCRWNGRSPSGPDAAHFRYHLWLLRRRWSGVVRQRPDLRRRLRQCRVRREYRRSRWRSSRARRGTTATRPISWALIEDAGKSLSDFKKARLFGPLGMIDTVFSVTDPKAHRIGLPNPGRDFKAGSERNPESFT